ncbi:MAG: hypothetical protein ACAI38_12870 [Myxococcota bacterium]|nr:hypothetical protein [Myxococcota bacterium]
MCKAILRLFSNPTITWDQRREMARALAKPEAPSQWPKSIGEWQQRTEKLIARGLDTTPRDLIEDFRELSIVEAGAQAAWGFTEERYRDMLIGGGDNPALVSARAALGEAGILKVAANAALRVLLDRAMKENCGEGK